MVRIEYVIFRVSWNGCYFKEYEYVEKEGGGNGGDKIFVIGFFLEWGLGIVDGIWLYVNM